jgi:hypothetical protein
VHCQLKGGEGGEGPGDAPHGTVEGGGLVGGRTRPLRRRVGQCGCMIDELCGPWFGSRGSVVWASPKETS